MKIEDFAAKKYWRENGEFFQQNKRPDFLEKIAKGGFDILFL
jgi:hypothetical protein